MRKLLCVVIAVLVSVSLVSAQDETTDFRYRGLESLFNLDNYYDFNSSGFGAKSRGMGGVHFAFYNEGFSSFLNPATMIYTNKSLMSLDVLNSEDKFNDYYSSGQYDSTTGMPIRNYEDVDGKHTRIIQAGAIAPFSYFDMDWWFGGGYRTVYDIHYKMSMPVSYPIDERDFERKIEQTRSIDAVNMALAANPHPNIALGVNFNMYVRGYRGNFWSPYEVTIDDADTIWIFHDKDKSTFSGSNFDFGAVVDFDQLKIGLSMSTPFTLKQSVVYSSLRYDNVHGYDNNEFGTINRINAKNKFPATFGGGISYMPMENVTLAADIEYKPYSKITIDIDPEVLMFENIYDHDPEWEDLTQFRVGAEYVLDAGFAQVPLRAGMQNLPGLKKYLKSLTTYRPDYADSIFEADSVSLEDEAVYGDQINTYLFSVGGGLKFEKIWFDIAYQFGSSEYAGYRTRTWIQSSDISDHVVLTDPLKLEYSRLYFSIGMLF